MSPLVLWALFTIDKVITLSIVCIVIPTIYMLIMFGISVTNGASEASNSRGDFQYPEKFWPGFSGVFVKMKRFNILAVILLSFGICVCTFLPSTKEAIAIVVVPKVIDYAKNSDEMMKIPDNVVKMANSFMEKKIVDWSDAIDTTVSKLDIIK